MYIPDNEVAFVTLALGEHYRRVLTTLMQSIVKFTNHHLYVITDDTQQHAGYYGDRVHFIKFDGLTDMPIITGTNVFNYNLKLVAIRWVQQNIDAPVICWMDCDSFLWGFDKFFVRNFPQHQGIWGRFRSPLKEYAGDNIVGAKAKALGIDISNMTARLPIENILVFKNNPIFRDFLHHWDLIAHDILSKNIRADWEALEFAISMERAGMPGYHIDGSYTICDHFRTLHQGYIHIPFL